MDLEKSSPPAPGWYADPEHPGSERYWDGSVWAEQRRPTQSSAATAAPTNGFAITALVCGIVGAVLAIPLGFVLFWAAWILGIIAIVFGVLARRRVDTDPALGRRGMATAGFVLGIITIVACVLWLILFIAVIDTTNDFFNDFQFCLENPDSIRCN